jgi:nucleotide-binding universal stress UspA family protein
MYRVLVPTDFSDSAEAALRMAIAVAADREPAEIVLLHVQGAVEPNYDEELGVLEPERLMAMLKMLQAEYAIKAAVPVEEVVVHGEPVEAILQYADERAVDLIVMGTHGRSGIAHLLMGSVAEGVLRRAACPVMTIKGVPDPAPENEADSDRS